MNEQAAKKNDIVNAQNGMEKKVESVDYRSSAGQGQEEKNVQVKVIHQPHSTNTSGGVLAAAATTLQSAKDAISKK
ncbi:hypothetical protein AAZX31_11G051000 [Glycine max]|uniref:Uncharacterized protein n=2 Tax=Glycine subgen. Soja TaxID=1462606 RepID=K7LN61_SOYBN|nr:hypothetical protein JHK87_030017 [Glycine soja]KAG4987774.1 hypothetical protein JHK85_030757 [Glycine max]KAG4993392.1 hypothetical protein JHK86_030219 [Glycine max]KAG5123394.1 hypothetical protein JHK82_030131 [Glycine max]KAG5144812.1 hypothetical protein JHK84_030355 [Glycine max]